MEIRIICTDKNEEGKDCWTTTQVWIGGVLQKDLTRISFDHEPGRRPELILRW